MYSDYHVHSYYSDDSIYEMENVVIDAINLGLEELCFTDHVDYGIKADWGEKGTGVFNLGKEVRNVDYPRYFDEIETLQKKYKDKIVIKKGLEFGIQMHTIPRYQELFNTYEMDFVLLSIHQINDLEFWTGEYQKGLTMQEAYDGYYDELYNVVQNFHDYSVLAHMDHIRRYLDKNLDCFEETKDAIRKILEVVIADGKGIEINTSSFRYDINGLTPSIEILKLYHDLGGKIITIGSDSHKKEDLAQHIESSKKVLKDIGFKYHCTFDKMQPIFHEL